MQALFFCSHIVFNLLIPNVDHQLHSKGFLHLGQGQWQLAPAFEHDGLRQARRRLSRRT